MRNCKAMDYETKIKWRIRILYLLLIAMLVYMVTVVELGGGDSRIMTDLASQFSRIVFFGGMIYVITRIVHRRKRTSATAISMTRAAASYWTSSWPACSSSPSPPPCST